mgnify:CR=1 FL=1
MKHSRRVGNDDEGLGSSPLHAGSARFSSTNISVDAATFVGVTFHDRERDNEANAPGVENSRRASPNDRSMNSRREYSKYLNMLFVAVQ